MMMTMMMMCLPLLLSFMILKTALAGSCSGGTYVFCGYCSTGTVCSDIPCSSNFFQSSCNSHSACRWVDSTSGSTFSSGDNNNEDGGDSGDSGSSPAVIGISVGVVVVVGLAVAAFFGAKKCRKVPVSKNAPQQFEVGPEKDVESGLEKKHDDCTTMQNGSNEQSSPTTNSVQAVVETVENLDGTSTKTTTTTTVHRNGGKTIVVKKETIKPMAEKAA